MLLSKVFEPFVERRPICVMARGVLERLLDAERIDDLFGQTAENGYTRRLLFSSLVRLMADVVLGVQPSAHAAFQAWEGEDKVSSTAFYNKLDRVETCVSAGLVQDSAEMVRPVVDALKVRFSPWLPGYRSRVLDGNHLSATEHRLEPLRSTWAAPLPGRALVVFDQESYLAERVFLTEDGHMQERRLIDEVLTMVDSDDLWIADRNFCTQKLLAGITRRNACFAIRQHGQLKGELLGKQRKLGRCPTGMVYEQAIRIHDPETGQALDLRRVTVQLDKPTRNDDRELHILSNLPAKAAGAIAVAELYARRWTIETVFHELTQTLECEINTLAYPKAALFSFCLALCVFNGVSLVKASLRATHGEEVVEQKVSGYYLSLEIRSTYDGMMIAIPDRHWKIFRTLTAKQLAAVLKQIATNVTLERYRKHPRSPKKPPPPKSKYNNGGHVSTYRLLKEQKSRC